MHEKWYYNAIATALEGDYRAIAAVRKNHATWQSAYCDLASRQNLPDPAFLAQTLSFYEIQLTLVEDPGYPQLLKETTHPPFGLYSKGQIIQENLVPFAIVGTRRATSEGKNTARTFARSLAKERFSIISGLAFGIDCASHEGCIEGGGITIAVLANGLDSIYPATNAKIGERIIREGGLMISEYPPGSPALPYRFLERNRIVSGLSRGILVIESPEKSGSLDTARFAFEENRDVFVVPGPITHPNFFGSHSLIRQGAELVTKPEDILASYGITHEEIPSQEKGEDDHATAYEKLILQALRKENTGLDVDKIISLTKLEPRIANQTLTFLLLKNNIEEEDGGYVIKKKS